MADSKKIRIPKWLIFTLLAATFWGLWGVIAKAIADEITPMQNQLLFTIGLAPSLIWAACSRNAKTGSNKRLGLCWGFVAGLLAALGNIACYAALSSGGKAAVVIPMTSVYPWITIIIAWLILKERINRMQLGGIVIAFIAILLLSGETALLGKPLEFVRQLALSKWLVYTVIAFSFWGIFSVTQKVSTNHVSAELSYIAWCVAFVPVAIVILLTLPINWNVPAWACWLAILAGALNGLGVCCAFIAYRAEGKASIVTPLAAAVQPVVTVALAVVLLHEIIKQVELFGIILAIIAAVALSYERKADVDPEVC